MKIDLNLNSRFPGIKAANFDFTIAHPDLGKKLINGRKVPDIMTPYNNKDLHKLVSRVGSLERKFPKLDPQAFSDAYYMVCSVAFEKDDFLTYVEFLTKFINIDTPDDKNAWQLDDLITSFGDMKPDQNNNLEAYKKRVAEKLHILLKTCFSAEKIELLKEKQKTRLIVPSIYSDLGKYFPKEMISVLQTMINSQKDERKKNALRFLLISQYFLTGEFEDPELESMESHAEELIKSIKKYKIKNSGQNIYYSSRHLILQLCYFDLFDLAEEAIEAFKLGKNDLIVKCFELIKKMDIDYFDAREGLKEIKPEYERSPEITNIMEKVFSKLLYKTVSKRMANISTYKESFPDFYLSLPEAPQTLEKIEKLMEKIFTKLLSFVKDKRGPINVFAQVGDRFVMLSYDQKHDIFELFFTANDKKDFLKAVYSSNKLMFVEGIYEGGAPAAIVDNPINVQFVLLNMLYHLATAFALSGKYKNRLHQQLAEVRAEVLGLMKKDILLDAERNYEASLDRFKEDMAFQGEKLFELEERLNLAQTISEEFIGSPKAGSYKLGDSDLLNGFIDNLEIVEKRSAEKMSKIWGFKFLLGRQKGKKNKFPIFINFRPKNGPAIPAVMTDECTIEILGKFGEENNDPRISKIMKRYLNELALEAIIKMNERSKRKKEGQARGNGQANSLSLAKIFNRRLYELIKKRGIKVLRWHTHTKEEDLYFPLDDQTSEGKDSALQGLGEENVWAQIEPKGQVKRLPVRPKKNGENGETNIATFKRNPSREKQKEILGDSRSLDDLFGLYIVTSIEIALKNGDKKNIELVSLFSVRDTEEEILEDELLERAEKELLGERFSDPLKLLQEFNGKDISKEDIEWAAKTKNIRVIEQYPAPFKVQRTYRRPDFRTVKDLLAEGFPLETEDYILSQQIDAEEKPLQAPRPIVMTTGKKESVPVLVKDYDDDESEPTQLSLSLPELDPAKIIEQASRIRSLHALHKWIGDLGEKVIIEAERTKLIEAGREDLAQKVRDVSNFTSLGYDIESFTIEGEPIKIEVKSTITESTSFPMSRNEILKSKEFGEEYYIFRVFLDLSDIDQNGNGSPSISIVTVKNPHEKSLDGEIMFLPSEFYMEEESQNVFVKMYTVFLHQLGYSVNFRTQADISN